MQFDQILEQVLALPREERVVLADALEVSLSNDGFATPEIAAAWAVEIKRRLDAYERGEMTARPVDEVMEEIRTTLAERAARRAAI